MEKFNNTSLFTGYLKQLLHDFNLPKYKIYTKQDRDYRNKYGVESPNIALVDLTTSKILSEVDFDKVNIDYENIDLNCVTYIKNGKLQRYIKYIEDGKEKLNWFSNNQYYFKNKKYLNETTNLIIKNNIYDSYTHEYLGKYLRFKRDFDNVDLMPLYNCFSNRVCDDLNIAAYSKSYDAETRTIKDIRRFEFNTSDSNYKIYMLPINIFKEYTIAIDCESEIELCCGIYGYTQDTREKFSTLPGYTYMNVVGSKFNSPFIYNKLMPETTDLFSETLKNGIVQNEDDLKLFIKIPANNNSTIVVLEGNYENWNDQIINLYSTESENSCLVAKTNNAAINFEYIDKITDLSRNIYCGPLQLLRLNTKEQIPFSDSLIEYLIGNAITNEDEISENITRAQKVIAAEVNKNKDDESGSAYRYNIENEGLWDERIRAILYEYMSNKFNQSGVILDNLGYINKYTEKNYCYSYMVGNKNKSISISQIDLDDKEIMEDL